MLNGLNFGGLANVSVAKKWLWLTSSRATSFGLSLRSGTQSVQETQSEKRWYTEASLQHETVDITVLIFLTLRDLYSR